MNPCDPLSNTFSIEKPRFFSVCVILLTFCSNLLKKCVFYMIWLACRSKNSKIREKYYTFHHFLCHAMPCHASLIDWFSSYFLPCQHDSYWKKFGHLEQCALWTFFCPKMVKLSLLKSGVWMSQLRGLGPPPTKFKFSQI